MWLPRRYKKKNPIAELEKIIRNKVHVVFRVVNVWNQNNIFQILSKAANVFDQRLLSTVTQ